LDALVDTLYQLFGREFLRNIATAYEQLEAAATCAALLVWPPDPATGKLT
jgi:hypothetical protein